MLRLKEIRQAAGWTQDQLSEITGLRRSNIARYENETRSLKLRDARKLADALGCTIDDLFQTNENQTA